MKYVSLVASETTPKRRELKLVSQRLMDSWVFKSTIMSHPLPEGLQEHRGMHGRFQAPAY